MDERGFLWSSFVCDEKLLLNPQTSCSAEHAEAMVELCGGQPVPFLIDTRGVTGTMTFLICELLTNNLKIQQLRLAEAFIVNSLHNKLIVNHYLRNSPKSGVKELFITEQAAVDWISALSSNQRASMTN